MVKKSEPHGMSLVNWSESFGCTIQKMITFATRASAQLENATWASWLIGPWAPWLAMVNWSKRFGSRTENELDCY